MMIRVFSPGSDEYKVALAEIYEQKRLHEENMKRGEPQLNWCDLATQVNSLVKISVKKQQQKQTKAVAASKLFSSYDIK